MEWEFTRGGAYTELIEFESDIAQISDLIVLFSESAGSMAELGAFTQNDEIARRMLVFVDNDNYAAGSFIKLGLLDYLTRKYGEEAVCVLQLAELKIEKISGLDGLDTQRLAAAADTALTFHLTIKPHEPTSFDPARHGHVTKLITGLIQHYSSLTIEEIESLLKKFGTDTSQEEIKKHLNCATLFGWVSKERVGFKTFFAALEGNRALHFELQPEIPRMDRSRWINEIVAHWRKTDPDRFSSIQAAIKRAKK
jgi:hypothetical protein